MARIPSQHLLNPRRKFFPRGRHTSLQVWNPRRIPLYWTPCQIRTTTRTDDTNMTIINLGCFGKNCVHWLDIRCLSLGPSVLRYSFLYNWRCSITLHVSYPACFRSPVPNYLNIPWWLPPWFQLATSPLPPLRELLLARWQPQSLAFPLYRDSQVPWIRCYLVRGPVRNPS